MITRPGGDELVILMPGLRCEPTLTERAHALSSAVAAPLKMTGIEGTVSANIGCSVFPDDTQDPDALLRYADRSMYAAKHTDRHFALFAQLPPTAPARAV